MLTKYRESARSSNELLGDILRESKNDFETPRRDINTVKAISI